MREMGDKAKARSTMKAHGVPITPGTGLLKDAGEAAGFIKKHGYPVIIKATAGGGRKGMRIARNDRELKEMFTICQAEAQKAFGNPDVYIEKFIENPRHIEI